MMSVNCLLAMLLSALLCSTPCLTSAHQKNGKTKKINNLQKRQAKLQKKLNQLYQQIRLLYYKPPLNKTPIRCHEPVRRFFDDATKMHIHWFLKKHIPTHQKQRLPNNKAVFPALYMLKIGKEHKKCFTSNRTIHTLWKTWTKKAKIIRALPGLRESIRNECKSILRHYLKRLKNGESSGIWNDSSRCIGLFGLKRMLSSRPRPRTKSRSKQKKTQPPKKEERNISGI